jgi:hypothetical protein
VNGPFRQSLVDLIILPQESVDDEDLRCQYDPDNRPLPVYGGELDLASATTRPVPGSYEIGGGLALEHEFSLLLVVQHGDVPVGRARLEAIVTQLALRIHEKRVELDAVTDPATGQYVTRIVWEIDWSPLTPNDTNQVARFIITIETQLDG